MTDRNLIYILIALVGLTLLVSIFRKRATVVAVTQTRSGEGQNSSNGQNATRTASDVIDRISEELATNQPSRTINL